MASQKAKSLALILVMILFIASVLLTTRLFYSSTEIKPISDAPQFVAKSTDGANVTLKSFEGRPVLLYFAYLTDETCPHCRAVNLAQSREVALLRANYTQAKVAIVTVDMTYDFSGAQAASAKSRYNMTWPVVNDPFTGNNTNRNFEKTGIGSKYLNYLLDGQGSLVNPTLILINQKSQIVGVYHVGYTPVGFDPDATELTPKEKEDLMTFAKLDDRVQKVINNEWGGTIEGKIFSGVSLGSMFMLGIFVSITPCALALMMSLTTYVAGVSRKKEIAAQGEGKGTGSSGERGPAESAGAANAQKGKKGLKVLGQKRESDAWFGATVGLAFTLGIGTVFFLIGCLFTYLGVIIQNAAVFYVIAGIILVAFGIHNIFGMGALYDRMRSKKVFEEEISADDIDLDAPPPKQSLFDRGKGFAMKIIDRYVVFGAYFLGMLLALGWAPCALAFVFPALILVMTQQMPVLVGGLHLFVFSVGYGVPVVMLAALTASIKVKVAEKAQKVGKWIPKTFGVIIIAIGVLMMLRWFGIYVW